MKNLTSGKPLKQILVFAVPLFIGQLFQLFYSLVDTRIVGETLGETSLAAVGATTTLSDMLTGLLNGFTNGSAIIVASCFGAGDEKNMKKAAGGTVVLGTGAAVLISILCLAFLSPILRILHIDAEILAESKSYISVILAGLLAAAFYNVCAAILRAVGDSLTPLLFLIFASFLNIFLDYMFILHLHMGVAGAAYATVVSQAGSALLCFCYMRRKYPQLALQSRCEKITADGAFHGIYGVFCEFGHIGAADQYQYIRDEHHCGPYRGKKSDFYFYAAFFRIGRYFGNLLRTEFRRGEI